QLLFINLLTDSLPAIAISMEQTDKSLLSEKPRDSKASFLTKRMTAGLIIGGALIAVSTIIAYCLGLSTLPEGNGAAACAMAFVTLCLARLFHGFNCRGDKSILKLGFTSNKTSLLAFFAGLTLLVVAVFIPGLNTLFGTEMLSSAEFGFCVGLGLIPSLLIQLGRVIKETLFNKK
ncbi:MAG: cation transporting ATPase C-terminal domain-containing protein, partial [Ruminiclostridium sp.]|nr:cation transporting ATPase C-terminal domain-containing protein [Ruminiclostridium sp.]